MLIISKAVLAMMIGFVLSIITGYVIIPLLKKFKAKQHISEYMVETHTKKKGTPTMGGLIFIVPTIITTVIFLLADKIEYSSNLFIVLMVFLSYSIIGFLDDIISIKRKSNKGLTIFQKLFLQVLIAVGFYYVYMKNGGEPLLWFYTLGMKFDIGFFFGVFVLLFLVGMSNAVNLTDGLDGLAGGLSVIAFAVIGIITWGSGWIEGNEGVAVFCFVLTGCLLAFLTFNTYPARVFMGDTGSLALGGTLATIGILNDHEITTIVIGGVFIMETMTCLIQIFSVRCFKKRVFPITPIHHTFERMGWEERDIVKLFWTVGLILGMAALAFGVWI